MDQIPFLNPEATRKNTQAQADHPAMPYQCDIFTFTASLSLFFTLSVSLSLYLCLAGPLACAIWGLIEGCEAQVRFGCRLLPTGIRRWRASAKTTAYIDPESLCTQWCLNQRERPTHTMAHTETQVRHMCKSNPNNKFGRSWSKPIQ